MRTNGKESRVEPDLPSAQRVLAEQPFSVLLGTRLAAFEETSTILEIDLRERHRQQHGFAHGGVISYLVDNAISFAAGTVLGPDLVTAGISVEYVSPGVGALLRAEACVVSHSSHSAIMRCDVTAHDNHDDHRGPGRLCAVGHGRALTRPSQQPLGSVR